MPPANFSMFITFNFQLKNLSNPDWQISALNLEFKYSLSIKMEMKFLPLTSDTSYFTPQMAPMNWIALFLSFNLMLLLVSQYIHFSKNV